jgi:hypothetical protein
MGLAVGVCLLLVLNALSGAYKEATRIPLQDVGADISIQRNGDVPEELNGVVFSCSAVTIRHDEVEAVRSMSGVRSVARAQLIGQLFKVGALMAQLHRALLERTIVIPFFNALFHCPKLSFVLA